MSLQKSKIMKISGFSFIRNGLEYGYLFLESIQSILPICDEFIVAVGNSFDGTRDAIVKLNSSKIKIIDTVWDENMRKNGKIFAQQTNIALNNIQGDWAICLQADEIIHEDDLNNIKNAILHFNNDLNVDGLLFDFLNFWGGYKYIRNSRRVHRYEIRVFRNIKSVRSYRDSQGFRKYTSVHAYEQGDSGKKLNVKKINVPVFHYSYSRPPDILKKKLNYFHSLWHDDNWVNKFVKTGNAFDYDNVDYLELFNGTHPKIMIDIIRAYKHEFEFDKSKSKIPFKVRLLHQIERFTGYRIGEYKNYKII